MRYFTRSKTRALHRAFIAPLGDSVIACSDVAAKPLLVDLAFPSRIRAVRALLAPAGPGAAEALVEAAEAVRASLARVHDEDSQGDWQGLAESLSIAAKLRSWHQAVRDGEADADRYLSRSPISWARQCRTIASLGKATV